MSSKTKTTAPKEEAKPALVPKLRFPGFSKPWVFEPLSKVLREHKLKNTEGRDVFSVSMEYGIVNQIELLGRSYAAADPSHYTIGRRYDVVYTKSPLKAFPFGIVKQCKFDGEVALSPLYGVFTPPNPHLGLMIEAYFESPNRSKDFLSPLCQKGAKNTLQITNTTFLSGRLPLPTEPAEQQKIAECLSSVDELMAAQARKVDALKTHKKGLMQQLFPREGETQPRLRFPEFQNAGEWARMSIQEMIDQRFIVGHLDGNHGELYPKAEEFSQNKEGIPYITANDFMNGSVEFSRCKRLPIERARLFKKGVAKDGDILFAHNATVGPVAKLNTTEEFVILSTTATYFRCNDKHLSNDFLQAALSSPDFVAQYSRVMSQSTRNQVPITTQRKLELHVPKPPEQERIAACMSSLDALITAETQKLEALKTHKKGLMQQLFPSPEEIEA
jgi:type I restriction enzyme S subunit